MQCNKVLFLQRNVFQRILNCRKQICSFHARQVFIGQRCADLFTGRIQECDNYDHHGLFFIDGHSKIWGMSDSFAQTCLHIVANEFSTFFKDAGRLLVGQVPATGKGKASQKLKDGSRKTLVQDSIHSTHQVLKCISRHSFLFGRPAGAWCAWF